MKEKVEFGVTTLIADENSFLVRKDSTNKYDVNNLANTFLTLSKSDNVNNYEQITLEEFEQNQIKETTLEEDLEAIDETI